MNFTFLASFIIFIIWLTYELSKHKKIEQEAIRSFWEKESQANQTRRKPLDTLDYIIIPLQQLPMQCRSKDEVVADCLDYITSLSTQKIVNLTGITNTELKLQYGAPNLPLLMDYDQRYTQLARTLQTWANRLYECACFDEAQSILEFAISTQTDVSASYILLARLYLRQERPEKVAELISHAELLRSASRPRIVRILQELCPCNG